jgi:PAS domain S-box-containing protein
VYVLTVTVPANHFAALLSQQRLPPEWIAAIFDGNHAQVARSHFSEMYIGRMANPALVKLMAEAVEGSIGVPNQDGVRVFAMFSRSTTSGWAVTIAIPKAVMAADVRQWLLWTVGGGLLLLMMGIALALFLARRIGGSIQALIAPALALGAGEPVDIGQLDLAEANEVGHSLVKASQLLQQRTAERERAEQRIAHLASFPELNTQPILEIDLQGKITYANPAARKRFPDVTEIGTKHPILNRWPAVTAALGADVQPQFLTREVDSDGSVFQQTVHYLPDVGFRVYFADITERKRAVEQLQKLNRTLAALSNSNQAQMHATDEPAFLQQVCRIIHEDCGYAMVWIGFAENDENKTVRPVAHAGFEEGYLETMRLTWADSERGRGPTGTAIRTGQPSICRNMLTDPAFLPWREAAIKRGYASSLVVPLKEDDKSFGAITIYSREPDAFSEGEVSLLTELAADLTYGIGTLRVRAARVQADAALRESEERFRALVTASSDVVYRMSPDWSERRQLHGRGFIADTEAPSRTWLREYIHPDDQSHVMAVINEAIRTKSIFELEHRVLRVDGSVGWTFSRAVPLQDAKGEIVEWFGAASDVSERKRAEEALRQSEVRWATTLRSIGDAVISTCARGKVIFMNAVAEKLTGWPLSEAQGRDLEEVFNIVNEMTREKPESPVAKVVRMGQVVGLANHTALISRDGTEVPIEDSGAPIRNQDGEITGVVLVFHDVVEKRKAERAVRNSERLATTGRLAATLAHEIHNPLDTVGNLLYLMDLAPDLQAARQHVALASQEVARVTQMTRHMLAFQRESSKPVPVNIEEILDSVVALFVRKIEAAGIQIEKQVRFEQEFLGLPSEIRQVFANLFGNAVEALEQNGKIRLRACASRNWRTGQRGLRVVVADNGPGIPAEVRGKIFEPFFTTKGEAGTGLGLWITSGIVEKNDGTLRLRTVTRTGRTGTCFSVFLPIK